MRRRTFGLAFGATILVLGGSVVPAYATDEPREIRVCITATGAVHTREFEPYVKDSLPSEWEPTWRTWALRTGAVAVRTYAWWAKQNHNYSGCDIKDSTADQKYVKDNLKKTPATNDAVNWTYGDRVEFDGDDGQVGERIYAKYLAETGGPTGRYGVAGPDKYLNGGKGDGHCPRDPNWGGETGSGLCQYGTQFFQNTANGNGCNSEPGDGYVTMLQHYYSNVVVRTGAWVFISEGTKCYVGDGTYRYEIWEDGDTGTRIERRMERIGPC